MLEPLADYAYGEEDKLIPYVQGLTQLNNTVGVKKQSVLNDVPQMTSLKLTIMILISFTINLWNIGST